MTAQQTVGETVEAAEQMVTNLRVVIDTTKLPDNVRALAHAELDQALETFYREAALALGIT